MIDFRKKNPSRRSNAPQAKKYRDYKSLLREDFNQRCGYCDDHEFFSETYYEIDHFVPQKIAAEKENDYSNLVYSCRSCNNSKRAKWPTKDVNLSNNGKEGWIDPCDSSYAIQFKRIFDGSICPKTDLGLWMWKELTLGNPIHRLKWILEQLRVELEKTDMLDIDNPIELKQIKELNTQYRKFEEQLKGIPNFF